MRHAGTSSIMTAFLMRRPVIALRRQSHTASPCDEDVEIRSSKPLVPPLAVAGAAIAVGGATAPLWIPAVLGGVGFGAGGVAAGTCLVVSLDKPLTYHVGSMAAAIQAGIGNVAAGSLFATCQGVGAGAALPAAWAAASAGVSGAGAMLGGWAARGRR
jgi:hypothetical protein